MPCCREPLRGSDPRPAHCRHRRGRMVKSFSPLARDAAPLPGLRHPNRIPPLPLVPPSDGVTTAWAPPRCCCYSCADTWASSLPGRSCRVSPSPHTFVEVRGREICLCGSRHHPAARVHRAPARSALRTPSCQVTISGDHSGKASVRPRYRLSRAKQKRSHGSRRNCFKGPLRTNKARAVTPKLKQTVRRSVNFRPCPTRAGTVPLSLPPFGEN